MTPAHARQTLGWIGLGRMGYPMAERLIKAGHDVRVWNRTRAKAEPLAALGATLVDQPSDLAGCDVVFTMVSSGKDLEQVYFGANGAATGARVPGIFVDCSSIGVEQGASIRQRIAALGARMLAAPVSGNGKCVRAGKLSQVVSGDAATFETVRPLLQAIAANGVAYVGEAELARYLTEVIQHELTPQHQKGLLEFARRAIALDLLPKGAMDALLGGTKNA